jgi:hypothetical protein
MRRLHEAQTPVLVEGDIASRQLEFEARLWWDARNSTVCRRRGSPDRGCSKMRCDENSVCWSSYFDGDEFGRRASGARVHRAFSCRSAAAAMTRLVG